MDLWVNWHLDVERTERQLDPTFGGAGSAGQYLAEMAAWAGNMQPLRSMYPRLAPFLHPPKRGRGEYQRPRRHRQYAIEQAVLDVGRIRALWARELKKKNRSDKLAVEIAAERWKVDAETLELELKRARV
jgi:hypothetical protein